MSRYYTIVLMKISKEIILDVVNGKCFVRGTEVAYIGLVKGDHALQLIFTNGKMQFVPAKDLLTCKEYKEMKYVDEMGKVIDHTNWRQALCSVSGVSGVSGVSRSILYSIFHFYGYKYKNMLDL